MASTTSARSSLPRPDLGNWVHLLAFGFGAGCSPKAPGTMGTLLAVGFYLPLSQLSLISYALVTVVVALVGIGLCGRAARDLGVHDHPGIVWDEIAGFLLTMFAAPAGWRYSEQRLDGPTKGAEFCGWALDMITVEGEAIGEKASSALTDA